MQLLSTNHNSRHQQCHNLTRSSTIAEGPSDVLFKLKCFQLPHNSAETTCTKSPEQKEVMKLEGYSGTMCNKHVHSTVMPSSRFHCPIGVINKPTTVELWISPVYLTNCCGEIFSVYNVDIAHMTMTTPT